jgi:UDP-glucose 4-epimerase
MKKFVVTGGCGFIGSHLVELLAGEGHSVIIIDDLSSGYVSNVSSINGDIKIYEAKVETFDFYSVGPLDAVFHLAAQASVPFSIDNFVSSSGTNMLSTFKVIEYCTHYNIPMVYASSSAVYGNLQFGVEMGEIELLSPYATDKYCMEMYATANFNLKGVSSFGLRFFNVYGPRQDASNPYSGVISIFADRMLKGYPITINGGYQTRDFVYVKDVVSCLFRSYEYLLQNKAAEISNILTGESISVDQLVDYLAEIINVKPEKNYRELPAGDPEKSLGSTEQMCRLLGVQTEQFIKIKDGLVDTINYIRENANR